MLHPIAQTDDHKFTVHQKDVSPALARSTNRPLPTRRISIRQAALEVNANSARENSSLRALGNSELAKIFPSPRVFSLYKYAALHGL